MYTIITGDTDKVLSSRLSSITEDAVLSLLIRLTKENTLVTVVQEPLLMLKG